MELKNFGKIGVLMGGPSSEREISLKSGQAVLQALTDLGLNTVGIDITNEGKDENINLLKRQNLDCAFIALHGRFGEDGSIQEILEEINLPYTASGVGASRLAMDKIESLAIFKNGGLKVPHSQVLEASSYNGVFNNKLGFPLVVKPANHGSSIGLSLVENEAQLPQAIELAFEYDQRIVIEEYIYGRELTVGVLGEEALPVVEIIPKNKFFDYNAKYQSGLTQYLAPAPLEVNLAKKVQEAGLKAHKLLGCSGCSRTDIILTKDEIPYLLEVNTIPGMTSTSLLPKAAKIIGINFEKLCFKLLELAYEKKKI